MISKKQADLTAIRGERVIKMKIETLEYIHELLLNENEKTYQVYDKESQLLNEHLDIEVEQQTAKEQGLKTKQSYEKYISAATALQDFEAQEW